MDLLRRRRKRQGAGWSQRPKHDLEDTAQPARCLLGKRSRQRRVGIILGRWGTWPGWTPLLLRMLGANGKFDFLLVSEEALSLIDDVQPVVKVPWKTRDSTAAIGTSESAKPTTPSCANSFRTTLHGERGEC